MLLVLAVIVLPALLVWAARLRTRYFLSISLLLFAPLAVFSVLQPNITTFYRNPLMASGYESWVLPATSLALVSLLSLWRLKQRPKILAFLVCVPLSFFVMLLGAWIA